MGIFGRGGESKTPDEAVNDGGATGDGPRGRVTEFVGISQDPARSQNRQTGLYEFWTTAGARIYLHDTELRRIVIDVGAPGRLRLTFEYDPEWVPPELASTPIVQFDCQDTTIIEWEVDHDSAGDSDAPQGEVSLFDWDGQDGFSLQTYSQFLTFTAGRVSVSVRPSDRA